MILAVKDHLSERVGGDGVRPLGVCMPVGDRMMIAERDEAVWPVSRMLFAGWTEQGEQLRVSYFDGVTILLNDHELKRNYRITTLAESGVSEDDIVPALDGRGGPPGGRGTETTCRGGPRGHGSGRSLCGISTAYIDRQEQLELPMWHIRAFVSDAHRSSNLASNLLLAVRLHTIEEFESGRQPSIPGAVVEVENMGIERVFPHAVWPYNEFVFIGVTPGGAHLRVFWFDGAGSRRERGSTESIRAGRLPIRV